jgi:hypothetical protein
MVTTVDECVEGDQVRWSDAATTTSRAMCATRVRGGARAGATHAVTARTDESAKESLRPAEDKTHSHARTILVTSGAPSGPCDNR